MTYNKNTVACCIVTFNRLELLKKVIDAIRSQSRKPDGIIVVNNSSTDGTAEWLADQNDLQVVTQANVGSSGGQYTSFKTAFDAGYEWLWVMDDDVLPAKTCLQILLENAETKHVSVPLRYGADGFPYINDTKVVNLSNPFKSIWKEIISPADLALESIKIDGPTFEGPLFHRSLVERIGLPEKKFFIYGDDTEYFLRAAKAGFEIYLYPQARFDRMLIPTPDIQFSWKTYYVIRNIIAIDVLHADFTVRTLRPFGYLFAWLRRCRNFSDARTVLKAFLNSYFYRSEN